MSMQTAGGPPPKSFAHLTSKGWAINPRYYETQGKSPFLSFLMSTETSGTHQVKVFGDAAQRFKDLHEGEPVSVMAKARRVPVMDGDHPAKNARGRPIYDTEFVVDKEFGELDDAKDIGEKPARSQEEADGGSRNGDQAAERQSGRAGGRDGDARQGSRTQPAAGGRAGRRS